VWRLYCAKIGKRVMTAKPLVLVSLLWRMPRPYYLRLKAASPLGGAGGFRGFGFSRCRSFVGYRAPIT
jgi:hypothetical protein